MTFDRFLHRFPLIIAAMLGLCLWASQAHAQGSTRATPCDPATPNNAICVVWTPPATNTDGMPTVLPLTYRVQRSMNDQTHYADLVTASTASNFYDKSLTPGLYFYRVFANCVGSGCSESVASNSASRTATSPPVTPNPPVIQVVQVVIGVNTAPVYTVLKDGSRSDTLAGFSPVGSECTGPVLFKYRKLSWRKPVVWMPWGVVATSSVAAPCA